MTRKLIEVALPLEAINKEAAREKSIRHGHPSTLHLWWARRPLAACRAVLFASLVDDPSSHPEQFPTEEAQEKERQRLFGIIGELVKWENSNKEEVLKRARTEILKSTGGHPPPVLDPFCGGGSIPLEAQRLGLEAHASDLNPVAVLITKALIEIPPKFAGQPPVNPESRKKLDHSKTWRAAEGLAEDIRCYGRWMSEHAEKRIGDKYPKVRLPTDQGGRQATVIAWLWARTIRCPNPACKGRVPLLRSLWLSRRNGQTAWLRPHRSSAERGAIEFEIGRGGGAPGNGTVGRRGAHCLLCETAIPLTTIREEGRGGRLGVQLVSIVAEGPAGRVFLAADPAHEPVASMPPPPWLPDTALPTQALGFRVQQYGFTTHASLFTARQLTALWTFISLVEETRQTICADAGANGYEDAAAREYAERVCTYLALGLSKAADLSSALCHWQSNAEHLKIAPTFTRHALSMTWDFAEGNPFSESSGNYARQFDLIAEVIQGLPATTSGCVVQRDAAAATESVRDVLISTDPPYYDNVPYADLSDFFYVWLRKALGQSYPDLMSTLLVPKAQELVAEPFRHGGAVGASRFFEAGLKRVFEGVRRAHDPRFPVTVYYAFRQAEEDGEGVAAASRTSTGWETMLESLIGSGLSVEGTWPMRTERPGRLRESGSNALASSIVLVCRNRADSAALATRKEFLAALKRELPRALKHLQHGNIAPVDLAQAAIGPGMAVFSRYSKVVEADGSRMPVRTALGLINQVLDEVLAEQESEFDSDTRWALAWFEQYGMNEGPYGDAETLSKAKDTSVEALRRDGLLASKRGKVQLLRRDELPPDWNPATDSRLTVWELTQHLIRRLEAGGEPAAAELLKRVGSLGDVARDLAYRLYNLCERKGWAQEATAYNSLVTSWSELTRLASQRSDAGTQPRLPGLGS